MLSGSRTGCRCSRVSLPIDSSAETLRTGQLTLPQGHFRHARHEKSFPHLFHLTIYAHLHLKVLALIVLPQVSVGREAEICASVIGLYAIIHRLIRALYPMSCVLILPKSEVLIDRDLSPLYPAAVPFVNLMSADRLSGLCFRSVDTLLQDMPRKRCRNDVHRHTH